DHREVGPGPRGAGRIRPPLPPAGRGRPGGRPLRPATRPGRGAAGGGGGGPPEGEGEFALRSPRRAGAAQDAGRFDRQLVPVEAPGPDGTSTWVRMDEGVRRDTSMEKLAGLKPAFRPDGQVTAGNSS